MAKKFVPNNNDFAIAYYRFSSHAQSDASIQQQRDAAEKYAAGHGLKIIKEYKDEAISGTTDQRPGFQLMLAEIGKIKPGALIIWKTDRLGRDRYDLAIAKKYIRDAGCIIHYIAEPITGDAPESALMEGVLESMAEYYSRQLRTNIKRGHLYNAQNCLYNGHKTLGYATEPAPEFGKNRQRYVIDPVTAPFVRKIFEDYAAGKPMVDIAKELNGLGMTTGRGKPFTVNSLAHTLNNRAYIGEYRYGDIVTPGGMPAIVSQEVFEAAKKRLVQNKRQGGQRAKGLAPDETPRFWLTGKLYCGKCGTPMQGCSGTSQHKGEKHYYYACGAARKKKCSLKYVRKDKIEGIVCFMLSQCLGDTGMLASLAADVAAYYQKEHEDKGYIEGLKAERVETEKALNNLVRAIEQGIFSETTQKRLTELESRKKALMEAIEAEEIKRAVTKNEISIQHFFDEYKNADLNDPAVRDYLLDYFVDKIFVYDDEIVLTSWYGDNKTEITWGDVDSVVVKKRKRKKGSRASASVPEYQTAMGLFAVPTDKDKRIPKLECLVILEPPYAQKRNCNVETYPVYINFSLDSLKNFSGRRNFTYRLSFDVEDFDGAAIDFSINIDDITRKYVIKKEESEILVKNVTYQNCGRILRAIRRFLRKIPLFGYNLKLVESDETVET